MDVIQRKLEVIDKQLAGGKDYHKRIISTCPLLFVAIGLIAGILIQSALTLSIRVWLILLAPCATAAISYCVLRIAYCVEETNPAYVIAYITLVCFVCLGGVRLSSFGQARPNDIRNLISHEFTRINTKKLKIKRLTAETEENAEEKSKLNSASSANSAVKESSRKLATIRGTILTEPYVNKYRDWAFARFKFTDPGSSFYLKIYEVKTIDGPVRDKSQRATAASSKRSSNGASWAKVAGTVRVWVDEPVLDLKAGDYIQAYCWLDRFKGPSNPGQFNTARYLARKNIFIAASVQSRDGIEVLEGGPAGTFTKLQRRLKQTAAQALVGNLSLEERSRGLLQALLLGYRRDIDSDTYRAFQQTGLLHFISLSGMHLGILAGIVWWLCKTAGLMKRGRATICIIAIGIFLLIVPPRAPTLRAAIICWVFCLSFFFRRHSNLFNTLSLAAIILLLIRPTQLFEAGWQLSFTTVLGILVFTKKIENFIYDKTDYWFWIVQSEEIPLVIRLIKKFGAKVITLFSVGFAAWLGGAGILLYHFYTITPLASVWTVIAFPLVAVILTVGFLKIILSLLLPTAAAALGVIVSGLSDLLIWIVERIANLGISEILIGHVPAALIIFYYGFIVFAGFVYLRRPPIKKAICAVMVLAMMVFVGALRWQRTHRDNLVLTTLDVGHGQAILAQLPGKANCLFDAGSLHKSNVGQRIITPFLNYIGINKIDAIIISHNDIDHVNGIPEIVERCKVVGVYANDAFFSKADQWGTAKFLNTSLNEKGVEIQPLSKDLNLNRSANIKILWPTKQICEDEKLGDNDKSAVCLIEFGGAEILLCSDIEKFAQRELLRAVPNLGAEVVVVPHHGSTKTLDDNFLQTIGANILIRSCGQRQYERQQTNMEKNKAKSFCTARDGAITVCINKDGTIMSRCVNE